MAKKSIKHFKKADKKKAAKSLLASLIELLGELGYETQGNEKSLKKVSKKLVAELPVSQAVAETTVIDHEEAKPLQSPQKDTTVPADSTDKRNDNKETVAQVTGKTSSVAIKKTPALQEIVDKEKKEAELSTKRTRKKP